MEEKNENLVLPFGRKIQVGNYTVLKYTKTLTKEQLRTLRKNAEKEGGLSGKTAEHRQLQRVGIPYIKVETISEIFSLTFCFNTQVFRWLDNCIPAALKAKERGEQLEKNSLADILHVFGMWMADVCTTGDQQYFIDKANALKGLIDRQKAFNGVVKPEADASGTVVESAEEKAEDDKVLEELRKEEEQKATITDMAKELSKETADTENAEEKADEVPVTENAEKGGSDGGQ